MLRDKESDDPGPRRWDLNTHPPPGTRERGHKGSLLGTHPEEKRNPAGVAGLKSRAKSQVNNAQHLSTRGNFQHAGVVGHRGAGRNEAASARAREPGG